MRPVGSPRREKISVITMRSQTESEPVEIKHCSAPLPLRQKTVQAFEAAKQKVAEITHQHPDPNYEVFIHTLGTASASPTKYRNGIIFFPSSSLSMTSY